MRRFFFMFAKPWILSLIGIILLSAIIWFGGPLLAFGDSKPFATVIVRLFSIGSLFFGWVLYGGLKVLSGKFASRRLMKAVTTESRVAVPGAKESAAEADLLAKRMQDALRMLHKLRLRGAARGQYLYRLPWYMFVGAPGSGKTTSLIHSGLKFPLADNAGGNAVSGVGGTRNCDWWFTDEAVLLDTAGRYTTQSSFKEVDQAAWRSILQLLKKYRRRRPINGVIVVVSVADLLQQTENERLTQANAIRERIKELHEQLGIRFPVYVMISKCDLLAGFIEFFDNLGKEERSQVWGVTFPLATQNDGLDHILSDFSKQFTTLEMQLQARVIDRMQSERDTGRRALIYGFPQQFAALGELLGTFLDDVFRATSYEEQALLRGVYFTSGTQEGSPIDRVMSSLAAAFGLGRQVLAPNVSSGRSYFITRLLQDVIFQEAGLSGVNVRYERQRRVLRWGAVAALTLVTLAVGTGLVTSYMLNKGLVQAAELSARELQKLAMQAQKGNSPLTTLQLLDTARSLSGSQVNNAHGVPFSMRFGLYRGDQLRTDATVVYRRLLRQLLLPHMVGRMEDQLRRGNANSTEYLYQLLRVYLMMADSKHFDAEAILAWISYDWERNLPDATDAQRAALLDHAVVILEDLGTGPASHQLDRELIENTRLILARMSLPKWMYERVKRDLVQNTVADFSLAGVGGRKTSLVLMRRSGEPLTRGIPGIYTRDGYRIFTKQVKQSVDDIAKNSWVFAPQESFAGSGRAEQLTVAIEQLYFNDYIKQWDELLADIGLVQFDNLDHAGRIMAILAAADSPLKRVLQAAAQETTLESAVTQKPAASSVTEVVKDKFDSYKKQLESALTTTQDPPVPVARTANPVDVHFGDLHKLAGMPDATGPVPLDDVLMSLALAGQYFDTADAAKRTGLVPPSSEPLSKLKREADGKPEVLANLLQEIDASGAGLTLNNERARLNALWVAGPGRFCRQAIGGRYPLVRNAAIEVTPDDFGNFFGPGGMMDDFFQKNLLSQVNANGEQWQWRPTRPGMAGLPSDILADFQRAARIRDIYFVGGGREPSFRFGLRPVSVDSAISRFDLNIDGQLLTYEKDRPAVPAAFLLPSGKGADEVRIEFQFQNGVHVLSTAGPWSWLRLIDKAHLEPTIQGERYKLTLDAEGKKIIFDMRASSVINPFRREILEQFRCRDRF